MAVRSWGREIRVVKIYSLSMSGWEMATLVSFWIWLMTWVLVMVCTSMTVVLLCFWSYKTEIWEI